MKEINIGEITGKIRTTVEIEVDMYRKLKQNDIKIIDALRAGMSLMLAEKGLSEYNNSLNIVRRCRSLAEKLDETTKRLNELVNPDLK